MSVEKHVCCLLVSSEPLFSLYLLLLMRVKCGIAQSTQCLLKPCLKYRIEALSASHCRHTWMSRLRFVMPPLTINGNLSSSWTLKFVPFFFYSKMISHLEGSQGADGGGRGYKSLQLITQTPHCGGQKTTKSCIKHSRNKTRWHNHVRSV